jgi:hypothetical protein
MNERQETNPSQLSEAAEMLADVSILLDTPARIALTLAFLICMVSSVLDKYAPETDTRPLAVQMAEARAEAVRGHLVAKNHDMAETIEAGDIVRYDSKLYSVRRKGCEGGISSGYGWVVCDGDGYHKTFSLEFSNKVWMLPEHLTAVYKFGTEEWKKAAVEMAGQGVQRPKPRKDPEATEDN